jgi:membrane associated rhomboid family serine protease
MSAAEPPVLLRTAPDHTLVDEWALALSADGLTPRVWPSGHGFAIGVPETQASRAADVLRMYDRENRRAVSEPEGPSEGGPDHRSSAQRPSDREGEASAGPPWNAFNLAGLAAAAGILAFFFLTQAGRPLGDWLELGSGDADRILRGEPWRAATALTLHVDLPHALANALFLALFVPPLLRALGGGVGGLALLLSGISGNLLSALFYGTDHRAIGASTALFGALGLLCALAVRRRVRAFGSSGAGKGGGHPGRVWIPLGAGMALLGILGAGKRADLVAHLFGLLSGLSIGALLSLAMPRRAGGAVQWACGALSVALVVAPWIAALRVPYPPP